VWCYEEGGAELSAEEIDAVLKTAQEVLMWARKEIGQRLANPHP
jgi:hypothetical protein